MKARPATHDGIDRPDRKKSVLVFVDRLSIQPTVRTTAKYTSIKR
jgi:hypothetical protein